MKGPPLGPGGEDMTWPDQVAPRGRKASSTRKIKPQTSNVIASERDSGLGFPLVETHHTLAKWTLHASLSCEWSALC